MKKTGLSLSGGSLRGFAHIGALQSLIREDIEITHVAGTSAGSMIGGLFACGIHPDEMEKIVRGISFRKHMDFRFPKKGLIKGDRIYQTLLRLTEGRYFSDLNIPFSVVCVDLVLGNLVVLNEGEVAKVIRASIAIPGFLPPVEIDNHVLVDGYVLNNNPANIVKEMGAEKVTSVQIKGTEVAHLNNVFSYLDRYLGIVSDLNTTRCIDSNTDVLIDIDLKEIGRFETRSLSKIIEMGRRQANKFLHSYEAVN